MQLVPLIPAWAQSLATLAVPALVALATFVPPAYAWVPGSLAFIAAFLSGQARPTPKWAAGKPLVQGPLVPLLVSAVPVLVALAQSLPAGGYLQISVYGLALVASGLAGLAAPEPLTLKPGVGNIAKGPIVELAAGCSLEDAARGLCK